MRLALVTGTSTGIGRATAVHLAARGFEVLAGVRRPADAPPGLEPLVLDVASERDVAAASLCWVTLLAGGTAAARRAVGARAIRLADAVAGAGLITFGVALLAL